MLTLETADIVPGDSFVRIVKVSDQGAALVGYTAEAKLLTGDQSSAITDAVALTQGADTEWSLDIPPVETAKVPNERGAVFLQVRFTGPKSQTGWAQLAVRPAL